MKLAPRRYRNLVSWLKKKHISLFEAIFEFELIQRITPKAYDSLQKFGRWIVELNDEIQRSEPETCGTFNVIRDSL